MAARGVVASPHHQATSAGGHVLAEGGTAADAAVAAAAVLAVVYPHQCSIGGDAVALLGEPGGRVTAFVGFGAAAAAIDVEAVRVAGGGVMPLYGPHAVTVPGAVSAWQALHGSAGRLPWSRLLGPARTLAEEGAQVAPGLRRGLVEERTRVLADPGLAALLSRDGQVLEVGDRFRQPALARSLGALADEGAGSLYAGALGERLAAGLAAVGSSITRDDLAAHACRVEPALHAHWRGRDVWTSPAPSQGSTLLTALAGIDRLGRDSDLLGADAGRLATVLAASARQRDQVLADPAPRPRGDTVAVVAADADGRTVSLIFSVFHGFGAGILDPGTGIVLQNRGACFSLDPGSPNLLRPGKRPAHTLMPVLVGTGGVPDGALGSMGGYAQPQVHAHLLLRLADGASPTEAVAAPRWVVDRSEPGQERERVQVEADVPEAVRRSLLAAGFALQERPRLDDEVGHAQLALRRDGVLVGASDPRADGGDAMLVP